jgi:2-haloacid dehalogenase
MIKAIVFDAYGTLYDVQSVAAITDAAFPGQGEYIAQVWRMKQLEYTWLRSLMGRYEDFWTVTREALAYTLATLDLITTEILIDEMASAYNSLATYPEAERVLESLQKYRLAILSNGNPAMLSALVGNSGFHRFLEVTMSVDGKRVYKPDPRAYEIVCETLDIRAHEVLFVSSNGFDVSGAKSFGFKVARIERVTKKNLRSAFMGVEMLGPRAMFMALRTQEETLGYEADFVIDSLDEIARLAATFDAA